MQNGLDKRSQHSWQTTEIVEIHAPPTSSNGPVDIAVNSVTPSEHEDDTDDAVTHDSPGLGNGDVTWNTPDPELERDYNDNSVFPSPPPPVFVVNADLTVSDGQSDNVADDNVPVVSDLVLTEAVAPVTAMSASVVSDPSPLDPPTLSEVSTSSAPPPPPPPPAPPLPTSFNTAVPPPPKLTTQSSANRDARRPSVQVPPQVQADLLAAVARRRTLVDSTDAEQIAKSIESRVQRNSKLQMVYRSGNRSSEQRTSPVTPTSGLLAPTSKPDQPKVAPTSEPDRPKVAENGKCLLNYDNVTFTKKTKVASLICCLRNTTEKQQIRT